MIFLLPAIIFFIALLLTYCLRSYIVSKNMLDIPNERSSHQVPIPRGGGAVIVILFFLCSGYLAFKKEISFPLFCALSSGIGVAMMGWLDDVISISATWRILMHFISAIGAIYFLQLHLSIPVYFLTLIAIVWCTNLYNFMDGIDGLASIEGISLSVIAAFMLALIGAIGMSLLCMVLAAVIAGFLVWNWSPAKIFMGDVGSGYLGFIFAVLALATSQFHLLPLSFWIVISAIFLCDATFTLLFRIYQKKRWYEAHREHAYQRLTQQGFSHRYVTLCVLFINTLILFPLSYFLFFHRHWQVEIMIGIILGLFFVWRRINKKSATLANNTRLQPDIA